MDDMVRVPTKESIARQALEAAEVAVAYALMALERLKAAGEEIADLEKRMRREVERLERARERLKG